MFGLIFWRMMEMMTTMKMMTITMMLMILVMRITVVLAAVTDAANGPLYPHGPPWMLVAADGFLHF